MINVHNPAIANMDATRLNRIGEINRRYVAENKLPGFVSLVARQGKIVHLDSCGYRSREQQLPYEADTIVRIYSMTKPIASVALLMLWEKALFDLYDPVYAYLPEFKDVMVYAGGELEAPDSPITIQQLLTHTAGLSYGSFGEPNPHPVDAMYDEAKLFDRTTCQSTEEMVKKIAALPLLYHPGTRWHYSMATDVVGRLVEVLSGQTLADFIDQHICQPLGMMDTAFHIAPEKADRFASLYLVTPDDPLSLRDEPATSNYLPPVSVHSGGAGMVSTAYDYFLFASCLLNKGVLNGQRILGRKTVERMCQNHIAPDLLPIGFEMSDPMEGAGFGLGVGVTMDPTRTGQMGSVGDFGWGGYAETICIIDPVEELIAINMTQCIPSSAYAIRSQFRTAVYQALT